MRIKAFQVLRRIAFHRVAGIYENVLAAYPNEPEAVKYLSQRDPSGRNKYLTKMMEWYAEERDPDEDEIEASEEMLANGLDNLEIELVVTLTKKFHDLANKLPPENRDHTRLSFDQLDSLLASYEYSRGQKSKDTQKVRLEEALKAGGTLVKATDEWALFKIDSDACALAFGKDLQWCISRADSFLWREYKNYGDEFYGYINFDQPGSRGVFQLAAISRESPVADGAVRKFDAGKVYYWDSRNQLVSPPSPELKSLVESHARKNSLGPYDRSPKKFYFLCVPGTTNSINVGLPFNGDFYQSPDEVAASLRRNSSKLEAQGFTLATVTLDAKTAARILSGTEAIGSNSIYTFDEDLPSSALLALDRYLPKLTKLFVLVHTLNVDQNGLNDSSNKAGVLKRLQEAFFDTQTPVYASISTFTELPDARREAARLAKLHDSPVTVIRLSIPSSHFSKQLAMVFEVKDVDSHLKILKTYRTSDG
jgi:hypothetical protein